VPYGFTLGFVAHFLVVRDSLTITSRDVSFMHVYIASQSLNNIPVSVIAGAVGGVVGILLIIFIVIIVVVVCLRRRKFKLV